jgi:hypothetical protein
MIEYFLEVMIKYISSMNKTQILFDKVIREDVDVYKGLSNNELTKYNVFAKIKGGSKELFRIFVPKLIYDNFYFLNGNYYVPLLYIIDKPIIIKEKSINLSSLFSSITFNFDNKMVIFTGRNTDIEMFVSAFLSGDSSDEAIEIGTNIKITNDEKKTTRYFNKMFNKSFKNNNEIQQYAEKLFFDEYTRYLYHNCYFENNINVSTLSDIIKISLLKFFRGEIFEFIDLRNKRISMIELMLAPLFKKIANIAYQVGRGYFIDEIMVDQYIIVKNFHKNEDKKTSNKVNFKSFHGLSGKTLYDIVNLYSSLLIHKCSFVKPGMQSPPKSIANIHPSHFGKICPITVSSINPGRMLSIIPEIYVDPYGQFLDLEEEVNENRK